jgi:hypothetical protein
MPLRSARGDADRIRGKGVYWRNRWVLSKMRKAERGGMLT